MSGSQMGTLFTVTTFGESHGKAVGVVLDGLPPCFPLNLAAIQEELNRRRPGQSAATTQRKEADTLEVLSGLFEGKTTGTPLAMWVANTDTHSSDYRNLRDCFRPSHSDFTYQKKYGIRDFNGGGRSSGRETVARVLAGAVAKQFLAAKGICLNAWTQSLGPVSCSSCDLSECRRNPLGAADSTAAEAMEKLVAEVRRSGDSIGGTVACRITGVPAGLGEPVFQKLDAALAAAMLSIGGVKGIEFGSGFDAALRRGSENNDLRDADGTRTNHAGGIEGGISNGEPIFFRLAVKPTPSIALPQATVNQKGEAVTLSVTGRHDPTLCPRLLPVVESMAAVVLFDFLLIQQAKQW